MRFDDRVRQLEEKVQGYYQRYWDISGDMSMVRSSLSVAHDRIDVALERGEEEEQKRRELEDKIDAAVSRVVCFFFYGFLFVIVKRLLLWVAA